MKNKVNNNYLSTSLFIMSLLVSIVFTDIDK